MCGICGFTGPADRAALEKMTGTLVHRGPDEDGFFSGDGVSLGMRRLSVVDVETGHQPVRGEDGRVVAIVNGEIYNHVELRAELEKEGHRFASDHSDAEVVVHAYERRGPDFVDDLNGMFAIALWDAKKKELHLSRDRAGVKPLFYAVINGKLVFGSELKAVLAHPDVRKEPDFEALYHYFSFKDVPAPRTAFSGVSSLLPGERLVFKDGKIEKTKWWTLRFREDENLGEAEARERILALLEDAVRLRMRCDVPFGAYLSGGVDSSSVVALMSRFGAKPVKTFSLGFEGGLANKQADLDFARAVAKAFKTEHHEHVMTSRELVEDLPSILGAFDQPFSGTVSTFFLSKLIRKHVKVALSGDGADELFGSYLSHREAARMKRLPSPADEARWRCGLHVFSDDEKKSLLSAAFLSRAGGASTLALVRSQFEAATASDPLDRVLETEYNTIFPDQVLAFVDSLSMAHSVETRSPFLDYRLAELAARVPGRLKIREGRVKDILKQAVAALLPAGVAERPKEGFVPPVFEWLAGPLKGWRADVLAPARLAKHGLFNADAVARLGDAQPAKTWNLMMFQVWWERCFA